jgi:hypothetical protein
MTAIEEEILFSQLQLVARGWSGRWTGYLPIIAKTGTGDPRSRAKRQVDWHAAPYLPFFAIRDIFNIRFG